MSQRQRVKRAQPKELRQLLEKSKLALRSRTSVQIEGISCPRTSGQISILKSANPSIFKMKSSNPPTLQVEQKGKERAKENSKPRKENTLRLDGCKSDSKRLLEELTRLRSKNESYRLFIDDERRLMKK
ncbi:hypothetical protein RND71_028605 [Anisodus tanguticus]|uniref:Uncharacterized protein n=1 Tax=Anisodus tanguticus TaxID=243964 RepID=A0AAE1RLR7_9SOLA|nr:hypothetical protein RND71_028605 [Anisodus tanguticus]